jgi:predicted ATPase
VESAGELLDALLGDDSGLVPLKQLLGKRGNPFFLEESVRTLVETKALVGERGRYRLTQPVQTIQVPATVQAVLAARIDRLAPDDKRLLQVASVVGKDVPSALLHAIADLPDDTLRVGLDRLQGAEFLYETSLFPEVEYTFKHALTHEVTYQSLLHERRRALHARIVQAIEGLYRDRLAEQVERLAHHALHGEVWDKALAYLRQAGAKAFARSANREAVAYFEEALKVLQHLPERPERLEDGIDLRIELRNALNSLGDFPGMLDVLREAEVLAERLGDQPRLGRVSAFLTVSLLRTGADRAAESAQRALAIGVALGDFGLQVMARYYLSIACHQLGDYARAIEFLRTNVDLLKGELSRESFGMPGIAAVSTRARMILSLAEMGQFREATQLADEALRMADAANEVFSQTLTYSAVGELHLARGQFSSALLVLERSLVLCETVPLFSQWTSACLGHARALTGHIAEALDILEQVVSRDRSQRGSQPLQLLALDAARGLGIGRLAAGYLLAGRLDEASHWAHQALARSRESRIRGTEAWTLQLLAEIASHRDPPDLSSAEHYYHQGLTLAGELRMRPLVAHCHLGLGKLYRRTGNREQAREHLATATTMCREMDMVYWLEKAEAEIRDLA